MEVRSIRAAGHEVWAQHDCGRLAGFSDAAYAEAGARIVEDARELYAGCDMIITNGTRPNDLYRIADGEDVGTRFKGGKTW